MSNLNQAQLFREHLQLLIRNLGVLERGEPTCCGITLCQSYTIAEIGRAGTITVNLLAEILGVDKSTVSRSVDKLVNNRILVRDNDLEDKRFVTLRLSDKGQSVFGEVENRKTLYYEGVLATIPVDKHEQIIESLQYLLQALKKAAPCCL